MVVASGSVVVVSVTTGRIGSPDEDHDPRRGVLAELGVVLRSSEPKGVAEEAAFAYKDIESVMAASASLVRPTKRLTPLGVVKG